jgi:hypothetical protein
LWLREVIEEVFYFCLVHWWRSSSSAIVQWHAELLRHVRHRQTAPALTG